MVSWVCSCMCDEMYVYMATMDQTAVVGGFVGMWWHLRLLGHRYGGVLFFSVLASGLFVVCFQSLLFP